MKVLFIGGTGIISSACSELAVQRGIDLHVLTRGRSQRPVPAQARILRGDIHDREAAARLIEGEHYDAVVNWVAFSPQDVQADIEMFAGRTDQYIFISSASAYQKPVGHLPITESTPLKNPFWEYSRNKIACEDLLTAAYRERDFPATIVRPSHTYDRTLLPFRGGYTMLDRMRQGKPVVVHGDGTSLWVLTHHRDFARGFVGLLGESRAVGDAFQITSDEVQTWNRIYTAIAEAAGAEFRPIHLPSELIAKFDPDWGASLLGDKSHSVIFDNTKIKRLVPGFRAEIPFYLGAEEIVAWYDADPSRRRVDEVFNRMLDEMIAAYERI